MAVRPFKGLSPTIAESAYVDEQAAVIGDVVIGEESSIWPMVVVRGDVNHIRIGDLTNIQDGSVLHVTHAHAAAPEGGYPLIIGNEVTVGHNVTLHGCTLGDRSLIGMGSIVLDGARLEAEVLLGAGSLVPPNKVLEGGYLWLGNPAKKIRPLSDSEREWFAYSARHYATLAGYHHV